MTIIIETDDIRVTNFTLRDIGNGRWEIVEVYCAIYDGNVLAIYETDAPVQAIVDLYNKNGHQACVSHHMALKIVRDNDFPPIVLIEAPGMYNIPYLLATRSKAVEIEMQKWEKERRDALAKLTARERVLLNIQNYLEEA